MSTSQVTLTGPTRPLKSTFGLKQGIILALRLCGAVVAMLVAYVVSSLLIHPNLPPAPAEGLDSGTALLLVALSTALVLAYPILRSRWCGLKLIAAIVLVQFGVESFMTQIETLFFINALKIPMDVLAGIVGAGLLRALIFAPLAVLVLGKLRGETLPQVPPRLQFSLAGWILRFALLAVVYVVVYFAFGYFVAFQWAEVRSYYAGTFNTDFTLPLFQVVRGALWAALALPIVALMRGKAWETILAVALAFGVLIATGVLFPNPYMPLMVRQAHFFELLSSMLVYGAIAGWLWTRRNPSARTTASEQKGNN